ncbi:MAG: undecaprenyl-phosphate glucose phosphotransferase [Planctomycetota bacterium]
MLQEQHRFFRSVLIASDTLFVVAAAVLAYVGRFHVLAPWFPPAEATTRYETHAIPVLAAAPIMLVAMLWANLYSPRRDQRFHREAAAVLKAVVVGLGLTIMFMTLFSKMLFGGRDYSRLQYLVYGVLVIGGLIAWRYAFRVGLRWLRRRGWNLRHVAIIGTGRLGQVVLHTLRRNTWTGITPRFFLSHHRQAGISECLGLPVRGGLDDLERELDAGGLSGVVIALPGRSATDLPDLLMRLERYPLDVRIVPDMNPKYMPLNMAVHDLDGMPVLSVRESPLGGWGRVAKRCLDVLGAAAGLVVFAVPMIAIAVAVRLSGPGPVVFRQRRMSLNGQIFHILKFRTMTHAAAEQTVPVAPEATDAWTKAGDARITAVGRFLRRTSLDELPQLVNVLLGEMSLVGPRPERPELITAFREHWRGYMLRQNVKAGMTGWAQVNGLRGDTSLRKRLQYDLFYIRNWSIAFDLRILWMTLFRGFAHPNAR